MSRVSKPLGEWQAVLAWCPLCWWRVVEDFHRSATREKIEKRFKELHRHDKPKCFEKIQVVFQEGESTGGRK